MAAESWFYARDGEQFGPVTAGALLEMAGKAELRRDDLVWSEGMEEWVAAGTRAELFGFGGADSAALPPVAVGYATPASLNYFHGGTLSVRYAGFWLRLVALFIDGIILSVPRNLIQFGFTWLGAVTRGPISIHHISALAPMVGLHACTTCMDWLYYSLFESSHLLATPGKMAVGIIVTDEAGVRISFGRATGRYFAKIVSAIILCVGYMMAGWTEKKQALHDILAKTLVVKKGAA